jgi:hypothetical protein
MHAKEGRERQLWHRTLCGSPISERRLGSKKGDTLVYVKAKARCRIVH